MVFAGMGRQEVAPFARRGSAGHPRATRAGRAGVAQAMRDHRDPSSRSAVVACRLSTAGPCHPGTAFPTRDVRTTKHQREFPDSRPIPALPLTCGHHGWGGGPWASRELRTQPIKNRPRTSRRGQGRTQTRSYVFDICRPSSTRSLTTCGLVPQPALRPGHRGAPPRGPRRSRKPPAPRCAPEASRPGDRRQTVRRVASGHPARLGRARATGSLRIAKPAKQTAHERGSNRSKAPTPTDRRPSRFAA